MGQVEEEQADGSTASMQYACNSFDKHQAGQACDVHEGTASAVPFLVASSSRAALPTACPVPAAVCPPMPPAGCYCSHAPTHSQANAFASVSTLRLLGGLLAPYCSMLSYSTRLTEMRRLVNDIIAPIAAQLAQQKHSQLAKLGCTVEEAPPGSVPADGKGISVAVGNQGRSASSSSSSGTKGVQAQVDGGSSSSSFVAGSQPVPAAPSSSGSVKQRRGGSSKGAGSAGGGKSKAGFASHAAAAATPCSNGAKQAEALSHKRFESGESCSGFLGARCCKLDRGARCALVCIACGWS